MTKLINYWNEHKQKLASPKLTVLLILLLAAYTIIGTIYQVEFGLYAAQKKFFNSPFVLLWFIPLPSVQLVLWALFINLVAGLQTRIRWKKVSLGLFMIHWGLLLLLLSGFYSLYFSHESFIELREEETTNRSSDYYDWQLLLVNESTSEKDSWALKNINIGKNYKPKHGPEFSVDNYFDNSRIFDTPFAGRILKKLPLSKEAEQNIPSLMLSTKLQKQHLQLHGDGLRTANISSNGNNYIFTLMRKKYTLPFALELLDVNRKLYPGTEIAKSYKSDVILHERSGLKRKLRISMNKPLRYWQYTVYQTSYGMDADGAEFSVFAVVENHGRLLPYIASLVMAFGIFLHFASSFFAFLRARALLTILLTLLMSASAVKAEEIASVPTNEPVLVAETSTASPEASTQAVSEQEPTASPAATEESPVPVVEEPIKAPEPVVVETKVTAPVATTKKPVELVKPTSPAATTTQNTEAVAKPEIETVKTNPPEPAKTEIHKKLPLVTLFNKVASIFSNKKTTELKSEALETEPQLNLDPGPVQLKIKSPKTKKIEPSKAPISKEKTKVSKVTTPPSPKKELSTIKTAAPNPESTTKENGKELTATAEPNKVELPKQSGLQERGSGLLDLSNLGKIQSAQFSRMTLVDKGRAKPVDTFARSILIRLSGKTNIKAEDSKLSANEWLTRLIFWPESVDNLNVFLINHPEVPEAFGLEPSHSRRYSFNELRSAADKINELGVMSLQVEEKQRSIVEQEIVRIFDNFHTYIQLRESLKPLMANADFRIESEGRNLSLYETLQHSNEIQEAILSVPLEASQSTVAGLNDEQKEKLGMGISLYAWVEGHKAYMNLFEREQQFRPLWLCDSSTSNCQWYTVWEVITNPELRDNSRLRSQLALLSRIQAAYEKADQDAFDRGLIEYTLRQHNSLKRNHQESVKTNLEIFYNNLNPLLLAKFFYCLALLFVLAASIAYTSKFSTIAQTLINSAFALHTFTIIARILILARPPVSNLYETFVFVSWVTVLLGLFLNTLRKEKQEYPLGTLLASFTGFLLLMISGKFAVEGDTMQVVIAVLNSNFWLSTHVICVTIGYAGVASAGVLAHVHLIKELISKFTNRERSSDPQEDIKVILGVLAFGFCFSFIGTILGGIWADQSWGRFWGWDPKENGALLIVLWSAAIFHARIAGLVGSRGTAIAAAVGTAVVMISWFGINLLGVGLHSYGFTSGLAFGLITYLIVETIFLSAAAYFTSQDK